MFRDIVHGFEGSLNKILQNTPPIETPIITLFVETTIDSIDGNSETVKENQTMETESVYV